MKNLQEYIDFVDLERQQQEAEHKNRSILSEDVLAWLGYAVNNLEVTKLTSTRIELTCNVNNSRFRPGDKVIIKNDNYKPFKGVLYEINDGGKKLILSETKMHKHKYLKGTKGWTIVEDPIDMYYSIQSALRKLIPGAPGWAFVNYLLDKKELKLPQKISSSSSMVEDIEKDSGLYFDQKKRSVLLKCLENPIVYGVHGPPGTGKTFILACATEGLMRMGKRVIVLAPTHQAVNNALSTINKLFPERLLVKYGDDLRKESLTQGIPIINKPKDLSFKGREKVLGMTFMAAIHNLMLRKKTMDAPNVVIIDEAGQLPLVQGLCAGLSGAGSTLLFGDDKQMPPVIPSELANDYRALSLFEKLRLSQPGTIDVLDISYRLNKHLCEAIGKVFYPKDKLQSSKKAKNQIFPINANYDKGESWIKEVLDPKQALLWLQVDSKNCRQVNIVEAEAVTKIIQTCFESGITNEKIAVVTPFRRQAMQIRQFIRKWAGNNQEIPIVDTVERVQGLTVEIVIVSLSASDKEYIKEIAEFLFSANRFNVAISRAKTKAIVVSSSAIFDTVPQSYSGLVVRNKCRKLLKSNHCRVVEYPSK